MKNKKAISLMVSYALLVVIAVAMGAIIYPFLKSYIFSEKAECQQDISLTINRVWCNSTTTRITVELFNSGLFNIDGAFVRFSNESRVVRPQLNPRNETFSQGALEPSSSRTDTFSISSQYEAGVNNYILEVQPAVQEKWTLVPCEGTIVTQPVDCSP